MRNGETIQYARNAGTKKIQEDQLTKYDGMRMMIDYFQIINYLIAIELVGVILIILNMSGKVEFLKNKKILLLGVALLGGGLIAKLSVYGLALGRIL